MKIKQTVLAIALLIGIGCFLVSPLASAACGGVTTALVDCDAASASEGVWGLLTTIIKILTGGVGVLAVGGIVYGSIIYTTANGNMEQTKKAKSIIYNVAFGLITYALMFSFLNFLIPGGVFG